MKKHNHSSDDRLIQYRGKYTRHSRGQALTNFASTHTPKQIILDKKGGKLYWCDRYWCDRYRHSSLLEEADRRRGVPGFTSEHCGGIIDPRTHRTLDYAHIQVRDLMKLPGRVKIGQPGTVTGGKRR
jgi:hypothetical protein